MNMAFPAPIEMDGPVVQTRLSPPPAWGFSQMGHGIRTTLDLPLNPGMGYNERLMARWPVRAWEDAGKGGAALRAPGEPPENNIELTNRLQLSQTKRQGGTLCREVFVGAMGGELGPTVGLVGSA